MHEQGPGLADQGADSVYLDQAFDAYAALRYLSQLDFVDPPRVAVLCQSMGGYSALYAVDRDLAAQYFKERFRATIASYPRLQHPRGLGDRADPGPDRGGGRLDPGGTVPRDGSTCTPDGATIALTVYPSAYHAFDAAQLKPGTRFLGHSLEHSEPVARDADQKLRAFLAAKLGGISPDEPTAK